MINPHPSPISFNNRVAQAFQVPHHRRGRRLPRFPDVRRDDLNVSSGQRALGEARGPATGPGRLPLHPPRRSSRALSVQSRGRNTVTKAAASALRRQSRANRLIGGGDAARHHQSQLGWGKNRHGISPSRCGSGRAEYRSPPPGTRRRHRPHVDLLLRQLAHRRLQAGKGKIRVVACGGAPEQKAGRGRWKRPGLPPRRRFHCRAAGIGKPSSLAVLSKASPAASSDKLP